MKVNEFVVKFWESEPPTYEVSWESDPDHAILKTKDWGEVAEKYGHCSIDGWDATIDDGLTIYIMLD